MRVHDHETRETHCARTSPQNKPCTLFPEHYRGNLPCSWEADIWRAEFQNGVTLPELQQRHGYQNIHVWGAALTGRSLGEAYTRCDVGTDGFTFCSWPEGHAHDGVPLHSWQMAKPEPAPARPDPAQVAPTTTVKHFDLGANFGATLYHASQEPYLQQAVQNDLARVTSKEQDVHMADLENTAAPATPPPSGNAFADPDDDLHSGVLGDIDPELEDRAWQVHQEAEKIARDMYAAAFHQALLSASAAVDSALDEAFTKREAHVNALLAARVAKLAELTNVLTKTSGVSPDAAVAIVVALHADLRAAHKAMLLPDSYDVVRGASGNLHVKRVVPPLPQLVHSDAESEVQTQITAHGGPAISDIAGSFGSTIVNPGRR